MLNIDGGTYTDVNIINADWQRSRLNRTKE